MPRLTSVMIMHKVWCLIWQTWVCIKRMHKLSSTQAWLYWQSLGVQWCLWRLFKKRQIQISQCASSFPQSRRHHCWRQLLRARTLLWVCPDHSSSRSHRMATSCTQSWPFPSVGDSLVCLLCLLCTRDTLHEGLPCSLWGRDGHDFLFKASRMV